MKYRVPVRFTYTEWVSWDADTPEEALNAVQGLDKETILSGVVIEPCDMDFDYDWNKYIAYDCVEEQEHEC